MQQSHEVFRVGAEPGTLITRRRCLSKSPYVEMFQFQFPSGVPPPFDSCFQQTLYPHPVDFPPPVTLPTRKQHITLCIVTNNMDSVSYEHTVIRMWLKIYGLYHSCGTQKDSVICFLAAGITPRIYRWCMWPWTRILTVKFQNHNIIGIWILLAYTTYSRPNVHLFKPNRQPPCPFLPPPPSHLLSSKTIWAPGC